MARFNFRLQPFLSVKEQMEAQKETEYGQALRKREEEKERLRLLEGQKEAQIQAFRQSLASKVDPASGRRYNQVIERLKIHIVQQIQRVEASERFAEKKRLELVEAMKERKALETVKDRALETFRIEENLAEQKRTDELVSYKYADKAANG